MSCGIKNPKVSLIIPVYNLGKDVLPCLNSVAGQDYANLEVLVVDDGSSDSSRTICETVVQDDRRFALYSKANGGLSSARNYGIERASGEYIMFLDGDDIISENAISLLVDMAQKHRADIVTTQLKKLASAQELKCRPSDSGKSVASGEALRRMLLLDGEPGSACGKLFSLNLFNDIRFPEGQLFEDFGVVAMLFARSKKIYISCANVYGYITRKGSITSARDYGMDHLLGMENSLNTVSIVASHYPELQQPLSAFASFCKLRVASKLSKKLVDAAIYKRYVKQAKEACRAVVFLPDISMTWRLRCGLFSFSIKAHNSLYRAYGLITGKVVV